MFTKNYYYNGIMLIYFILLFNSCKMSSVSRQRGDKDLGNGYYLFEDGPFTSIVYNNSPQYKSTGLEVIPFEVIKAKVVRNNIIAIRLNEDNIVKSYWIIDRSISINLDDCNDQKSCDSVLRSNVLGPLDSITFYKEIANKDIILNGFEK